MAAALNREDTWLERLTAENETEREAAISELRRLILRGLSRSLTNRYGGNFQAEDVVQEAMIKILNSLDSFEGRSRFTTWAMTVATRVGISALRRKHFQDVSLDRITPEDSLRIELAVDNAPTPDRVVDRRGIVETLKRLIEQELSDKQALAVRGLLDGLPIEEIADRSGSNRNAVYKLVHDARMKLRAGLERAGIAAEDVQTIFA